jgi:hypothetical protein
MTDTDGKVTFTQKKIYDVEIDSTLWDKTFSGGVKWNPHESRMRCEQQEEGSRFKNDYYRAQVDQCVQRDMTSLRG